MDLGKIIENAIPIPIKILVIIIGRDRLRVVYIIEYF